MGNGYGPFDPIPRDLGPAPGPEGLGHLRQWPETLRACVTSNGQAKTHREWIVRIAMRDIADALGDAEAYCAARVVLATPKPLNGDLYELFAPVGELLEKITRWQPHVARHLHTCHHLARGIKDWGDLEDHLTDVTRLRRDHGRKHGLWSLVRSTGPGCACWRSGCWRVLLSPRRRGVQALFAPRRQQWHFLQWGPASGLRHFPPLPFPVTHRHPTPASRAL